MHTILEGSEVMNKLMIAGIPVLISLGGLLVTLDMSAAAGEDNAGRIHELEIKQAEDQSTKVMVRQNTERLERLETVVIKNAEQLSKLSQSMAAVCQATNARCR